MNQIRTSQRGQSLILALVAVAVMSTFIFIWTSQFRMINNMDQKQAVLSNLELVREDLRILILNQAAWQNTVNDPANTSLACLKNKSNCTDASGPFVLRDEQNKLVVDNQKLGFSSTAAACMIGQDSDCNLIPSLTWTAFCTDPDCNPPLVQVDLTFKYSGPSMMGGINTDRFKMEITRENEFKSTRQVVSSSLGSLGACPAGQITNGIKSDGKISCIPEP